MHEPVMMNQVLTAMAVRPGGLYLDGTLGAGGHAAALLAGTGPDGALIGLDRDPAALERAAQRLADQPGRIILRHANFSTLEDVVRAEALPPLDGILLDLGFSSDQVDDPARGFSFQQDGPLDMRLDPTQGPTAAEWLNSAPQPELARIFKLYGEERAARRVAAAIAAARMRRPLQTTAELSALIVRVLGPQRGRIHPATRVFQAIRIYINAELDALATGLEGALRCLAPGGRLVVLSFHSLEDRLVKQCFTAHVGRQVALEAGGAEWQGALPPVRWIQHKPRQAEPDECARNPRARSAKLRAVERLAA